MHEILNILAVITSLVIMEGLLSVDNAMVIAAMVSHLPERERKKALFAGLLGAYVLRGVCLALASFLLARPWVKILGACYLIYLMCENLGQAEEGEKSTAEKAQKAGFWATVVAVNLADLAFSIDNILAAVALSSKLWVVVVGVFIGIAAMRFVAGLFVKLMEKRPVLQSIAYVLVGYVGIQLLAEVLIGVHVSEYVKFLAIASIIGSGLIFDRSTTLKRVLSPVFTWLGQGMGNIAELVDWALLPATALVRLTMRAAAALRKSR